MERRTFLSAGGITALAIAAGSSSIAARSSIVGADDGRTGPVAVVEEYYRRGAAAENTESFADDVGALAHGSSPLPFVAESAEDLPGFSFGAEQWELVEAAVAAEDVGAERIRGLSDFFAGSVTDEEVASLAAENALVAVTVAGDGINGGGELALEWLVAPEDGEWRLVWFDERNGPEAVVRRYYRRAAAAEDEAAFARQVAALSHGASPLPLVAESAMETPGSLFAAPRQELVGTEIVATDVEMERILAVSDFLAGALTAEELAAIAEENALVAATVVDDRLESGRFVREWLVATDGDEWRLVWF